MSIDNTRDQDWVNQVRHGGEWIRQTFMAPQSTLLAGDQVKRTRSPAEFKFTDTRLGGNFSINNPPQYTRHADLKTSARILPENGFTSSGGMGRFYSEQIDDNSHVIHMIFGVPQYNGMFTFFTGFYDGTSSYLARTGRSPGIFYRLGQIGGFVVSLAFVEYIAIFSVIRALADAPASKYYYFKPTMSSYWNRVNMITNELAINMGLIPPTLDWFKVGAYDELPDEEPDFSSEDVARWHEEYPDIFKKTGGIDVYQVANRAQRMAHLNRVRIKQILEESVSVEDIQERLGRYRQEAREEAPPTSTFETPDGETLEGIEALIAREHDMEGAAGYPDPENTGEEYDKIADKGYRRELEPGEEDTGGFWTSFADTLGFGEDEALEEELETDGTGRVERLITNSLANLQDGAYFVSFKVDHTGQVSESFSNSTKESEISSKLNGMSSSARSSRFTVSDGNTGIGLIDWATNGIRDIIGGVTDSLQMSGLVGLFGSSFVDIPKVWDSSTADFPKMDYTIQLRSPYGNDMSRLMNLYVPLACLLAGALPISTGKASFTSPFICQLYDIGRNQIRLGMIDSLSITRGVGNLGWTPDGKALGIDVSFSVVDLSSILHAPIVSGASITAGDNAFTDYMATLGSLSLSDQIYATRKLMLNITRKAEGLRSYWSVSHFSNSVFDNVVGRMISGIYSIPAVGAQ